MARTIKTEDDQIVQAGDRVFNYYDMKWGTIRADVDASGWFHVDHDDGSSALLDGSRIASYDPRERHPSRFGRTS